VAYLLTAAATAEAVSECGMALYPGDLVLPPDSEPTCKRCLRSLARAERLGIQAGMEMGK
jgi:hypothetical protein